MFQVGDMVCYPMHGVGTVEAIQEQNILGETNQYYLLRFLMGRMTALVPVKNAQNVGLRPLIWTSSSRATLWWWRTWSNAS